MISDTSGFNNCSCGSAELDIDCTACSEIAGVCYQSAWVECKVCHEEFSFELIEGDDNHTWNKFREAWNNFVK